MDSTPKPMSYCAIIGTLGKVQEFRYHRCQLTEDADRQNLKYLRFTCGPCV